MLDLARKVRGTDAVGVPVAEHETSIDGTKVHLLGIVKGLLSESSRVKNVIDAFGPDLVGLYIGREELDGLASVVDGVVQEVPLSSYERLYALRLSRFGEVQVPPPALVEAIRICQGRSITLRPLDFPENEYSDIYTRLIDGPTMIRQSLRLKSVARVRFDDPDPGSFALHWDRVVNRLSGYKDLEREREMRMARRIARLASRGGRHLHILELERLTGVLDSLSGTRTGQDKIK